MKKILIFVLAIFMVAILTACGGEDKLTVFKSEGDEYQVSASNSWKDAKGMLNPEADLQIENLKDEKYFIALLEPKMDFTDFSLQQYYDAITEPFLSGLDAPSQGDVEEVTINGNKALQYTLEASIDNINIVYLVAVIETPAHYGQLMAWTIKSKWDEHQEEYTNLINSFKEVN